MYEAQKQERYEFKYPPFYRTIKITFKDSDLQKVESGSQWFAMALKQYLQENVLGTRSPTSFKN